MTIAGEDVEAGYLQDVDGVMAHQAKTMLGFVQKLAEVPDSRTVYALTSHEKLCLLSQDNYDTPWWVTIEPNAFGILRIEYLMKDDLAPWPGACVTGDARTIEQAVEMVLIGIRESGGWNIP